MSTRALMVAARNLIRTTYSLDERHCKITASGKPIPKAGRVFYAVHDFGEQNRAPESDVHFHASGSFSVTISVKTAHVPVDRFDEVLYAPEMDSTQQEKGIYDRATKLRDLLHMNYSLMSSANTIIESTDAGRDKIIKPPRWLSIMDLGPQSVDWFWGDMQQSGRSIPGVAVRVAFGAA